MCISVQVGVLGPLFRKGCMCIVHAGKDLRLRSALLQGGCGPNQVEPQLAKLSPSLSALKPVRKTPGKDRVCGAAGEVGGKQQGKATKHVPQLSSLPGRRKNGNHMKKKKKKKQEWGGVRGGRPGPRRDRRQKEHRTGGGMVSAAKLCGSGDHASITQHRRTGFILSPGGCLPLMALPNSRKIFTNLLGHVGCPGIVAKKIDNSTATGLHP